MPLSRRQFLQFTIASGVATAFQSVAAPAAKPTICLFSKHLQWLPDYAQLASTTAELGFDGLDLTVRNNGHVLPERVTTDLPKAIKAIQAAGLRVPMMATDINRADATAERVLSTARELGVQHYRMGYYRYDLNRPIQPQLDEFKRHLSGLATLNERIGIRASYQNHSGRGYVGAPVWDLAWLLDGVSPQWVGSQYDVFHAMIEGHSSWEAGLRMLAPRFFTINAKDFRWEMKGRTTEHQSCPLGEGAVNWPAYFKTLNQLNVSVPISLHAEYSLGGAENGARQLSISPDVVKAALKRDLQQVRGYLNT